MIKQLVQQEGVRISVNVPNNSFKIHQGMTEPRKETDQQSKLGTLHILSQ